jgi:predicted metal-dependent phosphoesterase TrpH
LKVDLHVHSRLSKTFGFDHRSLERLVELARRRGLGGFALTEHVHARGFWDMHDELSARYAYSDGAYQPGEGLRVFSGMKVTAAERVDFIVIGELERLRELDRSFEPPLRDGHHPPAVELLIRAARLDLLLIEAHPYRPGKETAKLPLGDVLARVDAIEVNGRDYGSETRVAALAREHGRPLSGGSDAHYYLQVGVRSTGIPGDELSLRRLKDAFEAGETTACCKPYAPEVVRLCKEIKNIAKLREPRARADGGIRRGP